MAINWSDPASRCRLMERIGINAYNAALKLHLQQITVATINGYAIIPVDTSRYGRLYRVDGSGMAYHTRKEAEDYAATLEPRNAKQT